MKQWNVWELGDLLYSMGGTGFINVFFCQTNFHFLAWWASWDIRLSLKGDELSNSLENKDSSVEDSSVIDNDSLESSCFWHDELHFLGRHTSLKA